MRFAILTLVLLAFTILEVFIGGTRVLYTIPGVSLIALGGLLTFVPKLKFSSRTNIFALISSFLFAGYILVRNRLSTVDYIGRIQFFIMAGCLLIYLIYTLFLTRSPERKWFFYVLMALALVQVAIGVIQFTEHNQWMLLPWAQRRDDFWRASGFFVSPNHFAGYLEIIALMGLSFVVWGREGIIGKLLMGYIVLVCVAGIAISGSRGGYLSFTFGACVFMVLTMMAWKQLHPKRFVAIASVSAILGVLLFVGIIWMMFQSPIVGSRVLEINDPENMRFLLWASALEQFRIAPIFGTGASSFLYFGRLFRDPLVQADPIHVHNDYLQLLADYGIVAAVLFLIFLGIHLFSGGKAFARLVKRCQSTRESQSDGLALCVGSLSIIAAYIIHSAVDFNMQIPVNALLIAVIFAILANASTSGGEECGQPLPISLARWTLPFFSLAILFYGVPLVRGEYFAERARIAIRDYKLTEAFDFARKGIETEKKNPDLYYYAGEAAREMAFKKMGDPKAMGNAAIYYFTKGLEVFPFDSRLAVKLGQAHSNMDNYYAALSALTLAEEWDPNSSLVLAYRGLIELEGGYLDDAEDYYEQASDLGGEGAVIAQAGIEVVRKRREKGIASSPLSPEALQGAESVTKQLLQQEPQQNESELFQNGFDPTQIKDLNDLSK